jgi:hypothetical protein
MRGRSRIGLKRRWRAIASALAAYATLCAALRSLGESLSELLDPGAMDAVVR